MWIKEKFYIFQYVLAIKVGLIFFFFCDKFRILPQLIHLSVFNMGQQLTKQDVSEVVNRVVNEIIEKNNAELLENINDSFSQVEEKISNLQSEVVGIKAVMVTKDELKSELAKFETRMVTKEFFTDTLDDRLSRLRREFSKDTNKNERHLAATVFLLSKKKVFSQSEVTGILAS